MCTRIDSNSSVSNPSSGSSPAPQASGDLGTARARCFQVPKTNETAGTSNTDQAAQVQRQLTGILHGLM